MIIYPVQPVVFPRFSMDSLTQDLHQMLENWTTFADQHYKEWDYKPNCGHFFGGSYWYGLDTAYGSMSYAVIAAVRLKVLNQNDARTAELYRKAVSGVRYLCYTHDTGPADCVRVASHNPHCSNQKWGGKNDNFFQSSQHGNTIAAFGLAAWLVWEQLDDETKSMVQHVLESYADRWSVEPPRNGSYFDTQCEENAWTALGIATAANLFREHPRLQQWKQGYANWAVNSTVTSLDRMKDYQKFSVVTTHPDFTLENHAFVHPDYMGAAITLKGIIGIFETINGNPVSPEVTYNWDQLYEKTLYPWTGTDGIPIYIQGQDWWYNRQTTYLETHAFMYVYGNDDRAYEPMLRSADYVKKIQQSNLDYAFYVTRDSECRINQFQTIIDMEGPNAAGAVAYSLMALLFSDKQPPAQAYPAPEGIFYYPFGGSILRRTRDTISSFSWRNSVMGYTMGKNDMWDTTTKLCSSIGEIVCDSKTEKMVRSCQSEKVNIDADSYHVFADLSRAGGGVTQSVVFCSLPDGSTLYEEILSAEKDIRLDEIATGLIGIRNENYDKVELAKGYKDVWFDGRCHRMNGYLKDGAEDEVTIEKDIRFVNVDNTMGYLLSKPSCVKYINRHYFHSWKGIENSLILNYHQDIILKAGTKTEPFAVLTLPNTSRDITAGYRFERLHTDNNLVTAYLVGSDLVVINRSKADESVAIVLPCNDIYNGRTEIGANRIWRGRIKALRCENLSPVAEISAEGTQLEALAVDGAISVNQSTGQAAYTVMKDGKKMNHTPGLPGSYRL